MASIELRNSTPEFRVILGPGCLNLMGFLASKSWFKAELVFGILSSGRSVLFTVEDGPKTSELY